MPQIQFRDFLGGNIDAIDGAIESALMETRELALHIHTPSPDLPEIIFLPGLPGSLLDTANGSPVWVSIQRILAGTIGNDLDPAPAEGAPLNLVASDMVPGLYDVADLAWRAKGFAVNRFPFDWRLPPRQAALHLRTLITQRKALRQGVKFLPVAHSQGGLVICEYARQFPDFAADFARAVFLGTPFHGTYTALDALLGTAGFLNNIKTILDTANQNGQAVLDSVRGALCHMPGLAALLPDSGAFQNTASLFDAAQYDTRFRPAQALLDDAASFKNGLLNPTLLGRSTVIMSATFETAADDVLNGGVRTPGRTQKGDKTTTIGSGVPAGVLDAFEARLEHLLLPLDSEVIQCVTEIGMRGSVDTSKHKALTRVPAPLTAPLAHIAHLDAEVPEKVRELSARLQRGMPRTGDLLWLLSH